MKNRVSNILAAIIISFLELAFVVFISAYSWIVPPFVITKLWAWFIMPVFTSLPTLPLVVVIGSQMIVGMFRGPASSVKDVIWVKQQPTKTSWWIIGATLIGPWIALLLGYCLKVWFM